MLKTCIKCKLEKPSMGFRPGRNTCKECRLKQDRERPHHSRKDQISAEGYRTCYHCQKTFPNIEEHFYKGKKICKTCRLKQVARYTHRKKNTELTANDLKDDHIKDRGYLLKKLQEVHVSPPGTEGYVP